MYVVSWSSVCWLNLDLQSQINVVNYKYKRQLSGGSTVQSLSTYTLLLRITSTLCVCVCMCCMYLCYDKDPCCCPAAYSSSCGTVHTQGVSVANIIQQARAWLILWIMTWLHKRTQTPCLIILLKSPKSKWGRITVNGNVLRTEEAPWWHSMRFNSSTEMKWLHITKPSVIQIVFSWI